MPSSNGLQVLAIAIDSVDTTLIRRLLREGKLPALSSLLASGRWSEVDSTAPRGPGSVWPSFLSTQSPDVHGVYAEWLWQPSTMSVRRAAPVSDSFVHRLVESGYRVGLLDVPFSPFMDLSEGFIVSEWGVHDVLVGRMRSSPNSIRGSVSRYSHPFGVNPIEPITKNDPRGLKKLVDESHHGIEQRGLLGRKLISETGPQFALINFSETHRVGHDMWHTVEPQHDAYDGFRFLDVPPPQVFEEIIRAIDDQIAGLIELCNENASVAIFALHGMRPAGDIPMFLSALLRNRGFSYPPRWRSLSWRRRGQALAKSLKRHAPRRLKHFYQRNVDLSVRARLARSSVLEEQDWERTQAFQLPTDHPGLIRVNMKGREERGIVDRRNYDELCSELLELINSARASDGRPLVERVVQPDPDVVDPITSPLPEFTVDWSATAYLPDLEVPEELEASLLYQVRTGTHSENAFCITAGPISESIGDRVRTEDLHKFLVDGLAPQAPRR